MDRAKKECECSKDANARVAQGRPEYTGAPSRQLAPYTANLRTTFIKLITRAGHKPWPRLLHNMRASCATDWAEALPAHVVAKWLGHSPSVAAKHHLQRLQTRTSRWRSGGWHAWAILSRRHRPPKRPREARGFGAGDVVKGFRTANSTVPARWVRSSYMVV
jgi:hypothetical protein